MELLAKPKEALRKNLSEHLKRYRKMRKWDQHDLAAAVGLTAGGIRGYEQQTRFPKPEELQRLAEVLKTTPGKLLEDPAAVDQEDPNTREKLLVSLFEKALKLDDFHLARVLENVELRLEGLDDEDSLDDTDEVQGSG